MFIWMLHMFHTYVASVLSRRCIYFAMSFQVFSGVFVSVSDACFKCFICLQTYVANVSSRCFESRSGVAHVAMAPVTGEQRPATRLHLLPCAACLVHSSPLPPLPFPSLSSISPRQFELGDRARRGMARAEGKGVWLGAGAAGMRMSQVTRALWALSFTWGQNGVWWCV
jgi:hypothetical protein